MHDCIIIGLGIVGAACARELARYDISILALEAGSDMATGATRANSGIVHAGYDAKPGTKKAYYNVKGNALYDRWAKELDFPFIRNGSLIVAHSDDDLPALEELKELYNSCKEDIGHSFDESFENGITYMRSVNKSLADAYKELLSLICEIIIESDGVVSEEEIAEVKRLKAMCD